MTTLADLLRDPQFRRDVGDNASDFLKSASNAAASNITAPVDGLAWLLRKAGANVGNAPWGGSDWANNVGLTGTPKNKASLASLLGESAGGIAPMVGYAKAPEIAQGLLRAGDNLAAPALNNKQLGAVVYHGSPHKFDKFDASKIGTGEGAQAYGHGLYLAESPDVATSYMNTLAGNVNTKGAGYYPKINGKVVYDDFEDLELVRKIAAATEPKAGGLMGRGARPAVPSDTAIAELIAKNKVIANDPVYFPEARAEAVNQIKALGKYLGKNIEPSRASLYKVDLPDNAIAKMLDWDKPLSQQHPDVQAAMDKALKGKWAGMDMRPNDLGRSAAEIVSSPHGAQFLKQQGIPGIRYLDGGSRGAGQGSSNFVVFPGNESLLKILQRNGQDIP